MSSLARDIQILQVGEKGILGQIVGDIPLQERAFQRLEEVGLVWSPLRLHPVFRPEEDLPVGLPDTIAFHPVPLIGRDSRGVDFRFQVQEAALNEGLHRGKRQPQPRGLHHRFHAGVHLEILEQLLGILQGQRIHQIRRKGIALCLPQLVKDRLRDGPPGIHCVIRRTAFFRLSARAARASWGCVLSMMPVVPAKRICRNTNGLDHLEGIPQTLHALFLGKGRGFHKKLAADHLGLRAEAQLLGGELNHACFAAGQVGYRLVEVLKHRLSRLGGVGGCQEGLLRLFKDVDQAIRATGRPLFEAGISSQPQELPEQDHGFRRGVVAGLGGQRAKAQIVEVGAVRQQIRHLALGQAKPLDELEGLFQQHIGTGEAVYIGLGIERKLA